MGYTPMMQQYLEIKENYKDSILLFRLGDFYEIFFQDALTASKELEITLTGRDCGMEEKAPMCGVPYHAVDSYVARLVQKGYKIAICEQTEDPATAVGIVKREVIKVITPGTLSDLNLLDDKKNNYIMCIYNTGIFYGFAVCELSTGEFLCSSVCYGNTQDKLTDEIYRFKPAEICANEGFYKDRLINGYLKNKYQAYQTVLEDSYFDNLKTNARFEKQFGGEKADDMAVRAAGALLFYMDATQKTDLGHIKNFQNYKPESFMILDTSSRRNLELTENIREKSKKATLLWAIDKTLTSMGGRLLRRWIEQPLTNVHDINDRLDALEEYFNNFMERNEIRNILKSINDLERLTGKLVLGSINCRDLIAIKNSIENLPVLKSYTQRFYKPLNAWCHKIVDDLADIYRLIDDSIVNDPPFSVKEGGIIKEGYNKEADELKDVKNNGKNWLLELEAKERAETGIKNLKISYNRVFGYFIEITKSNYDLVPQRYVRKQTLSNCERYITDQLKEMEDNILGAEEKLVKLEYEIFCNIKNTLLENLDRLKLTAYAISHIDVLSSLAEVSSTNNYIKPVVDDGSEITIKDGRHPVVEKVIGSGDFTPNDIDINTDEDRFLIITGPNMAGKSTYMRQAAIIVLMAQAGIFVPASYARIGVADRIFTRVGASDDLAGGQSTFMIEMKEVANILENATAKSLIILDEIGRGTSTYDGLSIAYAVTEYIADNNKIGARSLFATHYHELTELEGKVQGVKNYCVSIKEENGEVIFLHRIKRGGADGSYGIEVANLAGVPDEVTKRAKKILEELEEADIVRRPKRQKRQIEGQFDLLTYSSLPKCADEVIKEIASLDLSQVTGLECLNLIYNLQKKIKKG